MAEYIFIGLVALLMLTPCIAAIWKTTSIRRWLWRVGCWRWVICCDRMVGDGVDQADLIERGHGSQSIDAFYESMFSMPCERREPTSSALELSTWREHVRLQAPRNALKHHLATIQVMTERSDSLTQPVQPVQPFPSPSPPPSACGQSPGEHDRIDAEVRDGTRESVVATP